MINKPIQKIIFGSPGTGKSHMIKAETLPSLGIDEEKNPENVIKSVFHPEYTYGDFMGKLLPITNDKNVEYSFYEGHFLRALAQSYKNILKVYKSDGTKISEPENVLLVIDEINRGNSSAIFGSIFQLLDREVDGWSSYETTLNGLVFRRLIDMIGKATTHNGKIIQVALPPFTTKDKAKDIDDIWEKISKLINLNIKNETIKIPPNLHIIATMNTSDNSIYHMDTAFKRRWEWQFIDVNSNLISEQGIAFNTEQEWFDFIIKLNEFIKSNYNYIRGIEDKQIGKYFIKTQDDKIGYAVIQSKLMFFIWDSVFNRDKKPLADLLGVSKDELVTFGDFALKVKAFIKAIQER